jgi:hypothetical protein
MRVNIAIPEAHVTKPVLDAALESVTRLNEQMIKGGAPTSHQLLEQGAKWKPEPPGQEHFDHAGILAQRGWGDCDDWAPLHAATHRVKRTDPGAKAVVVRSGPHMWHAVVERSDGTIEDPSKAAGMGPHGARGVHGAAVPLMHPPSSVSGYAEARPTLAIRPTPRGYQARVDVPWHNYVRGDDGGEGLSPSDYALAALHSAPVADTALVGAIMGAIDLADAGGYANPEHLARLHAVKDACEGCPHEELCHRYGPEHAAAATQLVGSFFGNLGHLLTAPITSAAHFVTHPSLSNFGHMFTDPAKAALHVAQPIAQMAQPFARFIPGVGPVASTALDVLSHGMPSSFGDLAQMAMHQIPGMGMMSQFMQPGAPPPMRPPMGPPPMGPGMYGPPPMNFAQAWPGHFG